MPVISIFIQIFELFDFTHTNTEDILAVSSLQGVLRVIMSLTDLKMQPTIHLENNAR
jgi:hypothetical protein